MNPAFCVTMSLKCALIGSSLLEQFFLIKSNTICIEIVSSYVPCRAVSMDMQYMDIGIVCCRPNRIYSRTMHLTFLTIINGKFLKNYSRQLISTFRFGKTFSYKTNFPSGWTEERICISKIFFLSIISHKNHLVKLASDIFSGNCVSLLIILVAAR